MAEFVLSASFCRRTFAHYEESRTYLRWMRLNLLIIQLKEYWIVENPCFLDGHKKEPNSSILQSNYLKREHLDIIIDFINRLLKK